MAEKLANRVCWGERIISIVILAALGMLVYWIFNPLVHTEVSSPLWEVSQSPAQPTETNSSSQPRSFLAQLAPRGFEPAGPSESFTPDSAYEKIDGKVEFYLPLGFQSLDCQRFISQTNADHMFEVFLYSFANVDGAFAAYTLQRRESARKTPVVPHGYVSENALIMLHGHRYVEMIASETAEPIMRAMESVAGQIAQNETVSNGLPPEVGWFPTNGLVPESMALNLHSGFGFEGFSRLFAATYSVSGTQVQAFFVPAKNSASALRLFTDYSSFLIDNGAVFETSPANIPGLRMYNVFGTYELLFVKGETLGGVHQADDLGAAVHVAQILFQHLATKQTQ